MTTQEFDELVAHLSNWGRWGEEDEVGTLRFITPDKRREAAALVREGIVVGCSQPLNLHARIDDPHPARLLPYWVTEELHGAALELLAMEPHGYSVTHLDALNHVHYRGKLYGGRPFSPYAQDVGPLSVANAQDGIVSRGVLVDLPRALGKRWLGPGEIAGLSDIERALADAGVEVGSGDVLVIRTGRLARDAELGIPPPDEGLAGISIECADWVHDRELAAMVCDAGLDPQPSEVEGVRIPWHILTIVVLGMMIVDNADLEGLAATCEQLGRWEFQLVVAPLVVPGGNSSPVNPIAVF